MLVPILVTSKGVHLFFLLLVKVQNVLKHSANGLCNMAAQSLIAMIAT